jgi:hypothetical protein
MTLDAIQIIQKERVQEMIRAAEQERLLQMAKPQSTGQPALRHSLAAWLGSQMVRWGSKLQQYGSASLRKV